MTRQPTSLSNIPLEASLLTTTFVPSRLDVKLSIGYPNADNLLFDLWQIPFGKELLDLRELVALFRFKNDAVTHNGSFVTHHRIARFVKDKCPIRLGCLRNVLPIESWRLITTEHSVGAINNLFKIVEVVQKFDYGFAPPDATWLGK